MTELLNKPTLLIADDEPGNVRILVELLRSDYTIKVATDGETVLKVAKSEPFPDLILLDVVMPGLDGYETCRILKQNEITKNIPVIFVTGKIDEKDESKAFEVGAVDYISKPFNPVIVKARVKTHLELKQRVDEEIIRSKSALNETLAQLSESQKMADIGAMVGGLTHDVNTPLGIGISAVTFLQKQTKNILENFANSTLNKSDLKNYLEQAEESSKIIFTNLERAVDLMKSFKQVVVDQGSKEKRIFNLSDYFNNIIMSLKPKLDKLKHKIHIDCPSDIEINSHPGDFAQIYTNLIINSIIHGFEGIDKGDIHIVLTQEGNHLSIDYKDNGVGISQENISKVFDPFFTTKKNKGGSGLGMHIIKNIVEKNLKGTIQLFSEPGKGMRILITLPVDICSSN